MIAAAGCDATGGVALSASRQGHTYQDAAGWTIDVPPGWHIARFSDSKDGITSAGVQLSDLQIPPPALHPGYPIQINGRVLPTHGVALIIATDTDPKLSRPAVAVPPLPAPDAANAPRYWSKGSAAADAPAIETLWFRVNGTTFIASAKISPKAPRGDIKAVDAIVRSLR